MRTEEHSVAIPAERRLYPRTPRIGAPGKKSMCWEAAETDAQNDESDKGRNQEEQKKAVRRILTKFFGTTT